MHSRERLNELLEEYFDLAPHDRAAYMDNVCGSDASLRADLERLLKADQQAQAEQFMKDPAIYGADSTPSTSAVVFMNGEKVAGRFRIVRFLGEGGMGQVFQAEDTILGGFVALKAIRPEIASDQHTFERFKREIRLGREVAHENVCRVFELDHHNVPPYVTMELVEGETLGQRLQREGRISAPEALALIEQMANGLGAAHHKGILHRDFKPGNVMLASTESGAVRAKVTDFGLARILGADSTLESDKLSGTPGYMAPELFEGASASVASDIYALGLVMYEMVTGAKPDFQRFTQRAPSPRKLAPELNETWEIAILRCLERDPTKRFSDAADVVKTIRGEPNQTQSATIGSGTAAKKVVTRRKLVASAVFTLLLLGVLALGLPAFQPLNTSLMVFQIANLTNNSDYDYLCSGTTTELVRRLNQLDGIRVVPVTGPRVRGSLHLADTRFALDGELEQSQKHALLTVKLMDRKDWTVIWSQKFEPELQNPLEMQSQISQGIVDALEHNVLGVPSNERAPYLTFRSLALRLRRFFGMQLPRPPTTSNEAMEAYMRGQHLADERTVPEVRSAIDYYQRALKEDPKFALAYAGLADAQFGLMEHHYAPQRDLLQTAREYAEQAVALGPDFAETYLILAEVRQELWDWPSAEQSFLHAIQLNPKLAVAHRRYAGMMIQFGRFDQAFKEVQIAMKLDPDNYPSRSAYGFYLFLARRYQEAVEQLQRILKDKDFLYGHINLGYVYAELGSISSGSTSEAYFKKAFGEAAIVAETERSALSPGASGDIVLPFSDCMYALFDAMSGDKAGSFKMLQRLELSGDQASPVELSQIYAALGDRDKALDLLERGAASKDRGLLYLKVQPFFDSLRNSQRFQALLKQMSL